MQRKQGAENPVNQEPKKPQPEHLVDIVEDQEEQDWQNLLDSIDATDVPIEMLKYLRVHMKDGNKMVFPVVKWSNEGTDFEEIKNLVSEWYKKNDKQILGSDFIVNLTKLKNTVKSQTKRILKDL